jgi:succinyl-CoA synthetase beta subunit
MKLFEFEAKEIFSKYNIPVPRGKIVYTPSEAYQAAEEISGPVAVKSQILVAGRGKAGGIKFGKNPEEVQTIAGALIGRQIKGLKVNSLLIEERLSILKELFVSIVVNRASRVYTILVSLEGGINIEEVTKSSPEKIIRYDVRVIEGFHIYEARVIAKKMGYKGRKMSVLAAIIYSLYHVVQDYDAELAEMNPLVETDDGAFVAADARLIVDDNALYRHPTLQEKALERDLTPKEAEAKRHGLSYLDLEGDIGVIGNGAGLVMATLDLVQLYGGKPANFLDVGGGASADSVRLALEIVLSKPEVKVVLINILGGITRCDEVARGVIDVLNEVKEKRPFVMRMVGTREEEARKMLMEVGINVMDGMEEAVERVIELVKR